MSQTIPDFKFEPERYALHNARPEPLDLMWSGLRFTLPPVDMVGPKPALFAEDEMPIPGTIVLKDAFTFDKEGALPGQGEAYNWRAKEAIINILGVEGHTGLARGKAADNGVSFIPVQCPRTRYEEIKLAGQKRYKTSLLQWAMETVESYGVARDKAKTAGVDPKPPGAEYYKAMSVLQMNNEITRKSLGVEEDIIQQEADDDEIAFKAYAYAIAEKIAKPVAEEQGADKVKVVERLLEDPKVQAAIRKKYSLRKKGYMDPEVAPGAEQPEPTEAV